MSDVHAISASQMRQVLEVARSLAATPDLNALLTLIARSAASLLHAERSSIFLHDQRTGELWTRVALGTKEIRVPETAGIVGHVFQSNALLSVPNPYDDPRFNREVDRRLGFTTRNLLTAPTRDVDGKPNGVLQVVNRHGGDFTGVDHAMIEILADQAGVAIQRHCLHQEVLRAAQLRHEMDLARAVQAATIPTRPPTVPGLRAVGWSQPASITGGDCYDLWAMPDGRLGIFVADASGHGLGAAVVVLQARTLARALGELNCDPTWILQRINDRLVSDLEPGLFVTVFAGSVSPAGDLHWSSAGHGPLLLRRGPVGPFETMEPLAPPVGVVDDLACEPTGRVRLEPGGMLVLMSDGIFEARNEAGDFFDIARVLELLDDRPEASPEAMLDTLRDAVTRWHGHDDPNDDQTIVIVQRSPDGV